jgi:sarcosine oxidase/L-pipecolate oxidase
MKLALEAKALWRSDPILKPYYHETGILFAGIPGPGITIVDNYNAVAGSSPATLIDPEDAKARFDGVYRDAP